MNKLAYHMRMTGLQISNEDVESRSAAVGSLKTAWSKITEVDKILKKAADVAAALGGDGKPPEALATEIEAAVQKKAAAFLSIDRPLEVGIVAGMVVIEMITPPPTLSGWHYTDVWAAALWSALGFQPQLAETKREELRVSVLDVARNRSILGGEKARERIPVPDFGPVSLPPNEVEKLPGIMKAAAGATIEALRRNATLDREELDFLWWAQLRRSRLLKRPLDGIDETARLVATGIEGAALLRRLPSEVHREIVLRTIVLNPAVPLSGVLASLGPDRETLAALYTSGLPTGSAILFPLVSAVVRGTIDGVPPGAEIERNAEEWGSRALLEGALLKLRTSGVVTL